MPKYLLQVLGTYYEVKAETVVDLERKAIALRDRHNLSGYTYRIFVDYKFNRDGIFS